MISVPFKVILEDACDLMGWDVDALDARQFASVRNAVSRALRQIWNGYWWPELMTCEQRAYAPEYDATVTYSPEAFVWMPATARYYQALQNTSGNAPAVWTGNEWVTNSPYWAVAAGVLTGGTWESSVAYDVGDQVLWQEDGNYYACIVAGTGNVPSGPQWAILYPFVHLVDLDEPGFTRLGRVRAVYAQNPKAFAGAARLEWEMGEANHIVVFAQLAKVWVEGLTLPHNLTGAAYDPAAAYTIAPHVTGPAASIMPTIDTSGQGYPGVVSLRARTLHTADQLAYLLFVATDGDGGAGWFRFIATSTDADDGVDVLKPDNLNIGDPGRWVRV